jgi:hypothetical protein
MEAIDLFVLNDTVMMDHRDQAGKLQFVGAVGPGTLAFTQNRLSKGMTYCYVVTAWNDCNGNGIFDPGMDMESAISNQACGTTQ